MAPGKLIHKFQSLYGVQWDLEQQYGAFLSEHRPCHYAIANGHQVLWVPKHTPCWFEPQTGRLVIDMGTQSRCECPPRDCPP